LMPEKTLLTISVASVPATPLQQPQIVTRTIEC
jgi:hypothetical protein